MKGYSRAGIGLRLATARLIAHERLDLQLTGFIAEGTLAVLDEAVGGRSVLVQVEVVVVFRNLVENHIPANVGAILARRDCRIEAPFVFRRFGIRFFRDGKTPVLMQGDVIRIILADPPDLDGGILTLRVDATHLCSTT